MIKVKRTNYSTQTTSIHTYDQFPCLWNEKFTHATGCHVRYDTSEIQHPCLMSKLQRDSSRTPPFWWELAHVRLLNLKRTENKTIKNRRRKKTTQKAENTGAKKWKKSTYLWMRAVCIINGSVNVQVVDDPRIVANRRALEDIELPIYFSENQYTTMPCEGSPDEFPQSSYDLALYNLPIRRKSACLFRCCRTHKIIARISSAKSRFEDTSRAFESLRDRNTKIRI